MKKLTAALNIAAFAGVIFATPIDIDFTKNAYYSPIDGKTTTGWFSTVENPSLKINITETKDGILNWANEISISGYDGDGIGVGDDEICGTGQEVMIEFSQSVCLHEFEVLDLFYEMNNRPKTSQVFGGYFETGYFTVDDGKFKTQFSALNQEVKLIPNQATSPGSFGQLIKEVPDLVINKITFGSFDQSGNFGGDNEITSGFFDQICNLGGNNDYAIAKLRVSSVPEPNLIMLMGFGLLSMLGLSRFRRKK